MKIKKGFAEKTMKEMVDRRVELHYLNDLYDKIYQRVYIRKLLALLFYGGLTGVLLILPTITQKFTVDFPLSGMANTAISIIVTLLIILGMLTSLFDVMYFMIPALRAMMYCDDKLSNKFISQSTIEVFKLQAMVDQYTHDEITRIHQKEKEIANSIVDKEIE